jgi:hypothetical protein
MVSSTHCIQDTSELFHRTPLSLLKWWEYAYKNYSFEKLNRIWLTLQSFINNMIEERGDNKFKTPHLNKDMLERDNQLPLSLAVTPEANNYPLNS